MITYNVRKMLHINVIPTFILQVYPEYMMPQFLYCTHNHLQRTSLDTSKSSIVSKEAQ